MTCRTLGSLLHFQTVSELEFSLSQEALQVGQIRRQKAADMGDSNGLPRMELGPFVVSFEFHLGPMCIGFRNPDQTPLPNIEGQHDFRFKL